METHRRKGDGKTETETGVIQLQTKDTKERKKLPETRRQAWESSSLRGSEGTNSAHTLISDFQPPELGEKKFLSF